MSDKKRMRQASLHDFIRIEKMPKNVATLVATKGRASTSNTLPVVSSTDVETSSTEGNDSNGTKNSVVILSDSNGTKMTDSVVIVSDSNGTVIIRDDPIETLPNDTQSSVELFPSENDSEVALEDPPADNTTESTKVDSQLTCDFLSESWDDVEIASEETPCTYDQLKRYTCVQHTLPSLQPLSDHSVLFNYNTVPGKTPMPYPQEYRDSWDSSHVRLPCSLQSLYPVKNALTGTPELQQRWTIIESALCNPILSSIDLEEAILTYNSQYASRWNFHILHQLFTEELQPDETRRFFDSVLPKIVDLCLKLPSICTQPIPLLVTGQTHKITLSQKQVASLLANSFFCTFPRRNTLSRNSEYNSFPSINFNTLFAGSGRPSKVEKLKCILNYFRRVTEEEPTGAITFHRQSVTDFPDWRNSDKPLPHLCVQSKGLIEVDGMGMLQVDFANKFVGGGVLSGGCVQEEIRFILCPELIVSRLFTERLNKNEALIITGCEQYNQYSGYSDTFRWEGDFEDCIPRDNWGRKVTQIVAMDALLFHVSHEQYKPELIQRELEKAYVGFLENGSDYLPAVATGNWGCGAFRGDPRLKSLLQLMSAAEVGRDVLYLTFNDEQLETDIKKMYSLLRKQKTTVGQLAHMLETFYQEVVKGKKVQLYSFLFQKIFDCQSDTE